MRLDELLPREHIIAPLAERTLQGALAALLARLTETGAVQQPGPITSALLGSRARDIVCIGPRVALPHCRSEHVEHLALALGVSPEPLVAEMLGPEARPQVVVLILAPPDATGHYLQVVSALARYFRDDRVIDALAAAGSADAVLEVARLADLRMQPRLTVRDIMSADVDFITPGAPLRQAVDRMVQRRLRALPVVGDKNEVLGIITERDIMRALLPRIPRVGHEDASAGATANETLSVRDVMTRSVLCVSEELGLEETANLMINKDVEQLPVTGDGKLVGVVSRSDLIRKLFGT